MDGMPMASMSCFPSPAPASRYSQDKTITPDNAATTMMRSRLRTASRLLRGDTLRGLRNGRERAVASLGLVLDGAGALDVGARHFGAAMLEAFRHVDLDAMRRSGDRILDGLHVADQDAGDFESRLAAALVESPLDRREDRIVH